MLVYLPSLFVLTVNHNLKVQLSGANKSVVNLSGRLDVVASGASELRYTGNPMLGSV